MTASKLRLGLILSLCFLAVDTARGQGAGPPSNDTFSERFQRYREDFYREQAPPGQPTPARQPIGVTGPGTDGGRTSRLPPLDVARRPEDAAPKRATPPAVDEAPTPMIAPRREFGPRNDSPGGASMNVQPQPAQPAPAAERTEAANDAGRTNEPVLHSGQSPVLSVETIGPRRVVIGKKAMFKVAVRNTGNVAAQDVVLTVEVPENVEIVGAEGQSIGSTKRVDDNLETILWTIPKMERHSREELLLGVVARKGVPLNLTVSLTHRPVATETSVEVSEPKLTMSLDGPSEVAYGKQEVFRLTLANPGTADAEGVELQLAAADPNDPAPPATKLGNIAAGSRKIVELELTARQGGTLRIQATASAQGNLSADVAETILIRKPELELSVAAPRNRYSGTAARYKVALANPGNAAAQDLQIAALLPPGAEFVSAEAGGTYNKEQGKITWKLPKLDADDLVELGFVAKLAEVGQAKLQVACQAEAGLKDETSAVTIVEAIADVEMRIQDPRSPIATGEEIEYEIVLRNRGTKKAEGIDVEAFLSAGLEAQPSRTANLYEISSGHVRFRRVDQLAPGQELILKLRATGVVPGNQVVRVELRCPSLDLSIAKEEATRFYSDEEEDGPLAPISLDTPAEARVSDRPADEPQRIRMPFGQ